MARVRRHRGFAVLVAALSLVAALQAAPPADARSLVSGTLGTDAPDEEVVDGWAVRPADLTPGAEVRETLSVDGSIGARRTDRLHIVNQLDLPLSFTLVVATLHTPDGIPTYGEPDLVSDAATWVRLAPASRFVTVAPRTAVDVPVEVRFPNTAVVGERLAAIAVRRTDTGERRHVPLRIRTNGPLTAQLRLERADLTIRSPRFDPTRPSSAELAVTVRNTGNTILTGPLSVRLDTLFDRKAVLRPSDEDEELVLEPGATWSATVTGSAWPTFALAPEVEIAVPTGVVDEDGEEVRRPIVATGTSRTVLPVAQLTWLVATVAAVAAGWWSARAAARRRAKGTEVPPLALEAPT